MTDKLKSAAKLIASDARGALRTKRFVTIPVLAVNYGIEPSDELTAELRTMLPGVEITMSRGKSFYRFRKVTT